METLQKIENRLLPVKEEIKKQAKWAVATPARLGLLSLSLIVAAFVAKGFSMILSVLVWPALVLGGLGVCSAIVYGIIVLIASSTPTPEYVEEDEDDDYHDEW